VGWASDRLSALPKEQIAGGSLENWELGTRDAGAYATFSDMVAYLEWLGGQVCEAADRRARLEAAGRAISAYESGLIRGMLQGVGNQPGLADHSGVTLIGGATVDGREGVVSFRLAGMDSADLVEHLRRRGIRVHVRKNDHYSGNVLGPLGMDDCVRVSVSHYNTHDEVARFLAAVREAADGVA
jgi:selenocysteine lyase/cysteine desulfurase